MVGGSETEGRDRRSWGLAKALGLEFRDPALEQEYERHRAETDFRVADRLAAVAAMAVAAAHAVRRAVGTLIGAGGADRGADHHRWTLAFVAGAAMAAALFCMYSSAKRGDRHRKWTNLRRRILVIGFRSAACAAWIASVPSWPGSWPNSSRENPFSRCRWPGGCDASTISMTIWLLLRSGCLPLAATSIGFPLLFRHHVPVSLAAACTMWRLRVDRTCGPAASFCPSRVLSTWRLMSEASRAAVGSAYWAGGLAGWGATPPSSPDAACRHVIAHALAVFGVLAPGCALWVGETRSRTAFLASRGVVVGHGAELSSRSKPETGCLWRTVRCAYMLAVVCGACWMATWDGFQVR